MRIPHRLGTLLTAAALLCGPAHAKNFISGQIIDRNGEPVTRAIVSLTPGNVQLVTDHQGHFLIDYLRDDSGERIRLAKKTDYTIEVFKPGFHTQAVALFFKRGEIAMEPVTLTAESIQVKDQGENLDPGVYQDTTHSAGANYEGQ